MKTEAQIVKQFKKHLRITKDGLSRQYRNTEDCQAFYAGDMADFWIGASGVDQFGVKKRAMVQINKVKPVINSVKGFMAQNRRDVKYNARINGDKIQEAYSNYSNGMATYIRAKAYADQKETKQDGEVLINGYGAIETDLTYSNGQATTDPNGQVTMGNLDPLMLGWDPYAKETNLLDKRWVFYEQIYDMENALALFQESREDDFQQADADDLRDGDGEYKYYARGGRYNKIKESSVEWSDQKSEKVKVFFYQWFDYEPFYRCDNPLYDQSITSPLILTSIAQHLDIIAQSQDEEDDDLFAFDPRAQIMSFNEKTREMLVEAFGDVLEINEQRRKVYYKAVISGDHVFTSFRSICQQGYSIKFKTGDYDSKNKIWVGMVNSLKEPVLYYNKSLTELMFIIGSNSKGGVLIEEDAVDDIAKFEQQYAKTDATIVVNSGAIGQNKIKAKKEPFSPTGYENIVTLTNNDIADVSVDKSFLGSSENKDETGILQKRRIKQVVSGLACYFDAITLYSYEHARLLQDLMYVYAENNSGGQFSILGKDGKVQFMTIARNKLVAEYDLTMIEGPQSPEDKQEFAAMLQGMAEKVAQVDPATAKLILSISVKYLPIEYADQQQIIQALVAQNGMVPVQQMQALEQKLQALTSQLNMAQVAEVNSKTALNTANAKLATMKSVETQAKVPVLSSQVTKNKASAFKDVHQVQLDEYVAKRDPNPQLEA